MRTEALIFLAVAAGSALGGLARYALGGIVARSFGETFPWGTLVVNVLGSFLIGLVATLTGPDGRLLVSPVTRQFWMPGLFGPQQPPAHGQDPAALGRPADGRGDRRRGAQGPALLDAIEPMMGSGLVTLERVQLIRYGAPAGG
jgi:hypothetical protein